MLCDEESYLLALIRYIHLNPVRADIVKTIEELDGHGGKVSRTRAIIALRCKEELG